MLESRAFGDFWQHCLVAEGAIDLAAESVVNPWDVAAVQVLVEQAGGRFTDLDGVARYDGGTALSSTGCCTTPRWPCCARECETEAIRGRYRRDTEPFMTRRQAGLVRPHLRSGRCSLQCAAYVTEAHPCDSETSAS